MSAPAQSSTSSPQSAVPARSASAGRATVVCPACQSPAAADRKFCGQCGQQLWEPCPQCGALGPAAETFCGGCGANAAERLADLELEWNAALADAETLRGALRHREALDRLTAPRRVEHSRIARLAERGRTLAEQIRGEHAARAAEATTALAEAERLAEARDYDRARCALEAIPPALRTPEIESLLARLRGISEEVTSLALEIRKAVAARQTDGLLDRVERLLELAPHHEEAHKLAEQLRRREAAGDARRREVICQKATRLLKQHEYSRAVALLEQVAPAARNAAYWSLAAHAEELAWLYRQLTTAPTADATLVEIAARLRKLQPDDPRLERLEQQLGARRQAAEEDSRCRPARWARPPERTHVGLPTDWFDVWQRIDPAPADARRLLAAEPGRFGVACGLALQGLGRARVTIDLPTSEKKSVFSRLAPQRRRGAATAAWGLDLGPGGLKAVRLVADKKSCRVAVEAVELIEHERPPSRCESHLERQAIVAATLGRLLERHDLSAAPVCVGLGGPQVLGRFVHLPPMPEKSLQQAAAYEARAQIPLPLDTVCWGWQALGGDEEQGYDLLLVAVKQADLNCHLDLFTSAGVTPDLVLSDCVALYNLLHHNLWCGGEAGAADDAVPTATPTVDPAAVALLDVGAEATNVIVASPDKLWFRTIGRGAGEASARLVGELKLTHEQAEQLQRRPALARRVQTVDAALEPVFARLSSEIGRSLEACRRHDTDLEPERLLGTGGGFQLYGLHRHLWHGPQQAPPGVA